MLPYYSFLASSEPYDLFSLMHDLSTYIRDKTVIHILLLTMITCSDRQGKLPSVSPSRLFCSYSAQAIYFPFLGAHVFYFGRSFIHCVGPASEILGLCSSTLMSTTSQRVEGMS
jgi:hypothetical protein